jgi:hypothetical protein
MSVDRSGSTEMDHDVPLAMLAILLAAIMLVASFLFIDEQHQQDAAALLRNAAVTKAR